MCLGDSGDNNRTQPKQHQHEQKSFRMRRHQMKEEEKKKYERDCGTLRTAVWRARFTVSACVCERSLCARDEKMIKLKEI